MLLGVVMLGALVFLLQVLWSDASGARSAGSQLAAPLLGPSVESARPQRTGLTWPALPDAQPAALSAPSIPTPDTLTGWAQHDADVATFSGRLIDAAGRALPGAEVSWLPDESTRRAAQHASHGALPQQLTTLSDASGRFALLAPWLRRDLQALRDAERDVPRLIVGGHGFAWRALPASGFLGGDYDFGDITLRAGETGFRLQIVEPSGAPAVGVEVELRPNRGRREELEQVSLVRPLWTREQRLTDAQGRLQLGVPDATQMWMVFHPREAAMQRMGNVDLERGAFVDLGTFTLRDGLSLAGHVRDARGVGVPNAQLELANAGFIIPALERQRRVDVAWKGHTDAQGHFVVRGLPATEKELVLSVSAPGFHAIEKSPVSPGTQDLEFQLDDAPSLQVRVHSAPSGAPLPDALILARALDESPRNDPPTNGTGVPVPVSAGHVSRLGRFGALIFVSAPGHLPQRVDISPSELDAGTLDVRLEPGPEVCGLIVDARGAPVEGASVIFTQGAHSWSRHDSTGFGRHEFHADERGRFAAPALPFGVWTPRVSHPKFWPRTLPAFDSAQPPECSEVALEASSGVRGVLFDADGAPAAGRSLRFSFTPPESGAQARSTGKSVVGEKGSAVTDQHGRFALDGLRDGVFRVESWPGLDTHVQLAPGALLDVELRCLAAARVVGEVTVRGVPLPDARLSARHDGEVFDRARNVAVSTDALGRFELELPAEGRYVLHLETASGVGVTREVNVRFGDLQRVDIALAGGRLAGALFLTDEGVSMPAGVQFQLRRDDQGVARFDVGLDGAFTAEPLEPGDYTLRLEHPLLPRVWWGPYTLGLDEQRDDLELEVDGAAALKLSLRSPEGKPLEGFVALVDPDTGALLRTDDVDWGVVHFESLTPRDYRIVHARYGWPHDENGPLAPDDFEWPPGTLFTLLGSDLVRLRAFEQAELEFSVNAAER
ncbi:MAG: hypothetical protein DHS20C15_26570 [Planctomycetota bacterium]|nr:MAG: hypothetical protein DHS20C15_26570 [Planctomycetota bacterium]